MRKVLISLSLICTISLMAQQPLQKLDYVRPDKYNEKVIKRYNRCHFRAALEQPFVKCGIKSKDLTAIFGVRTNSLMSNDDIEINFLKKRIQNPIYNDKEDRVFFVVIKNKTNQTIYIDRSHCFRIDSDGSKYCYFDPENRVDRESRQRMIAIPPHGKKNLTDFRWVKNKTGAFVEIIEYPEEFLWSTDAAKMYEGYVHYGESKLFTEEDSPFYRSFLISYSKQEDFSTYSLAMVNFYMKEVIGMYYPENYEYDAVNCLLTGDDEYSITSWTRLY